MHTLSLCALCHCTVLQCNALAPPAMPKPITQANYTFITTAKTLNQTWYMAALIIGSLNLKNHIH